MSEGLRSQCGSRRSLEDWFAPFRGHRMFVTEQKPFAVTLGTHYGPIPVIALRYWRERGWIKLVNDRNKGRVRFSTWRVTMEDE